MELPSIEVLGTEKIAVWAVFGWYMVGAALRALYVFLDWCRRGRDSRTKTGRQAAAAAAQGLIATAALASVWTGGYAGLLFGKFGYELPFEIVIAPLSSVSAGFLIEAFLIERLRKWWTAKREDRSDG